MIVALEVMINGNSQTHCARAAFFYQGHGAVLHGPQAEAFIKLVCRDIAKPKKS